MNEPTEDSVHVDEETLNALNRIAAVDGELDASDIRALIPDSAIFREFLEDVGLLQDELALRILESATELKGLRTNRRLRTRVKPVPKGYHSVTPYLIVDDVVGAIEFYKRAFGGKEETRTEGPLGKIAHAELTIGDSVIVLQNEFPGAPMRSPRLLGGSTAGIILYVEDVDAVFRRAVSAGARVIFAVADMFWGDRFGQISDPFGHVWSLATHKEDLTPEELTRRAQALTQQFSKNLGG
jgi:PhnB protein